MGGSLDEFLGREMWLVHGGVGAVAIVVDVTENLDSDGERAVGSDVGGPVCVVVIDVAAGADDAQPVGGGISATLTKTAMMTIRVPLNDFQTNGVDLTKITNVLLTL